MANISLPATGFVQSVFAGDEANIEELKTDLNTIWEKLGDNVTGHTHNGSAGNSLYVPAPFLIERLLDGQETTVTTYEAPISSFEEGSWRSGNISSTSWTTVFSKEFTNLSAQCKNNVVFFELEWAMQQGLYSLSLYSQWQYQMPDLSWATFVYQARNNPSTTVFLRTCGILKFNGKSPLHIRLQGCVDIAGYNNYWLYIGKKSKVTIWK